MARTETLQEPHQGERYIFVGGAPRSGTTLVQNMLDCHSEVLGGPEFLHLAAIARLRNEMQGTVAKGWTSQYASDEDIDRAIAGMIDALVLPLADRHRATHISEKTPGNVLAFETLMALFPRARCINVVRDPRAVVASMLRVGATARERGVTLQPFTRDTRAAVSYVKACLAAGYHAGEAEPERVLHVRYERLVTEPEAETRRICSFLGLPWEKLMLTPAARRHIGEREITRLSGSLWYDHESYQRDPDRASLDKWTRDLGPMQKAFIVTAFADFEPLHRLGVRMDPAGLSPGERTIGRAIAGLRRSRQALRTARRGTA